MPEAQFYTAASIESLRQRARDSVLSQETQLRPAGRPDEEDGCWAVSQCDPGAMVKAFDRLDLEPGFRLRAYCYASSIGGNGFVYAMPQGTRFPDPYLCPRSKFHFLEPPVPPGALEDFMSAIHGDRSALSYLQASILGRELQEFGAQWHGLDWRTHTVLDRHPWLTGFVNREVRNRPVKTEWTWLETVDEWRPSVFLDEAAVRVVFYSYSELYGRRIVRHTDEFWAGYCFGSRTQVVADGGLGYCP